MICMRRQPGFTLLEVLVALSMVCILSLSLYASLRVAFKAREAAANVVAPGRAVGVAMDLIRQDLENALAPTVIAPTGGGGAVVSATPGASLTPVLIGAFVGETDNSGAVLDFYCMGHGYGDTTDPTQAGGVRHVELALETAQGEADSSLVRRVWRNVMPSPGQEPDPEVEVLCRGVKSLALSYYDGTAWSDSWDSTAQDNAVPTAVQVTLEVAAPPLTTDPHPTYRVSRIFLLSCQQQASTTGGGS